MIKEALQFIIGLKEPAYKEYAGSLFSDRVVQPVKPPLCNRVKFNTLTGLVDFVNAQHEEGCVMIHVVNEECVHILDLELDGARQREVYGQADLENHGETFRFGEFMDAETFVIELQAKFKPTPDLGEVIKIAGSVTSGSSIDVEDDGMTQKVAQKAGVTLKTKAEMKNPVTLAPYRTFREIEQPASTFVFRARQGADGMPRFALFASDGGQWKIEAIQAIKEYFQKHLGSYTIIA